MLSLKFKLDAAMSQYTILYDMMVDKNGFPKEVYNHELIRPMSEFLDSHDLNVLSPLVDARLKSQGYDRGSISTFHALFFCEPKFLKITG